MTNVPQTNTIPFGLILPFAGPLVDTRDIDHLFTRGYMVCDGRYLPADLNHPNFGPLFRAIGVLWGSTPGMFRLPDLRGRFLRGQGGSTRVNPENTNLATYQDGHIQSHQHSLQFYRKDHRGDESQEHRPYVHRFSSSTQNGAHAWPRQYVQSTGGQETRPTNASINWVIMAVNQGPPGPALTYSEFLSQVVQPNAATESELSVTNAVLDLERAAEDGAREEVLERVLELVKRLSLPASG